MHFEDIASGAPWHPEPAARYNAVNRLLRADSGGSSAAMPPRRTLTVDVRNDSDVELPAYSPVRFWGAVTPEPPDAPPGFSVIAATDPFSPWGLTTGRITPGRWGRAAVQGIALAAPATDGSGNVSAFGLGDRIAPAADGLIRAERGAPVLDRAHSGHPATVVLDPGYERYSGQFRVWCKSRSDRRFKVDWPGGSQIQACGRIEDFPGRTWVNAEEVTLPSEYSEADVYLVVSYTRGPYGTASYTVAFTVATNRPTGDLFAFRLAAIHADGMVEQATAYRDGITMPGWVL